MPGGARSWNPVKRIKNIIDNHLAVFKLLHQEK